MAAPLVEILRAVRSKAAACMLQACALWLLSPSCTGGGSAGAPARAPAITAFGPGQARITAGHATYLLAAFLDGVGRIDHGIGPVTSGVPVPVQPATTTDYTLTVENSGGSSATASAFVEVLPAPAILSFTASPPAVFPGDGATLVAVFSGGSGSLDQGLGSVTSGTPVATGPLQAPASFTLLVRNELGDQAEATTRVDLRGEGSFLPTSGSMALDMFSVGAALLPGGEALIISHSAELFDPLGGRFVPLPDPDRARRYPVATMLLDGRVLITGQGSGVLFDPATRVFSPTLPMLADRVFHTATLLADGRVLVAGGTDLSVDPDIPGAYPSFTTFATAELFDPTVNAFLPAGSMGSPRMQHAAALLPGGKVLIAGGCSTYQVRTDIYSSLTSCELFDPATGSFTPTGPMAVARSSPAAASLLDGKVLVTGGTIPGWQAPPTASTEIYEPGTGAFTPTAGMATPRAAHTATVFPGGLVLVSGGGTSQFEWYDPARRLFIPGGDTGCPFFFLNQVPLADGKVLFVGGTTGLDGTGLPPLPPTIFDPQDPAPPPPCITGLVPGESWVLAGSSTTLTPYFFNGSGALDHGIGAVTSGSPVPVQPGSDTIYTLTVTGAGGMAARTAAIKVAASRTPVILGFTASPPIVTEGDGTVLSWGTVGAARLSLDQGIGDVSSTVAVSVNPGATTEYRLTAENGEGAVASAINVTVVPSPAILGFTPSSTSVAAGTNVVLTGEFTNGTGTVYQYVGTGPRQYLGALMSGAGLATGGITRDTRFELSVTNPAERCVTANAYVSVE